MSDKKLAQNQGVHEQAVMACSYVIEKEDDKKQTPIPPAEGIPISAGTMSSLSFVADDSRVEMLAESLIDTQKSELEFLRDLAKNQRDTIMTKKAKITKLKEKLVDYQAKAAEEKSNHEQELAVKDAEIKQLHDCISSLREHKQHSEVISEQNNYADSTIEKLSGACSEKASLKEAAEKIANLEDKLAVLKEAALKRQTEFKLPMSLTDCDVVYHGKHGTHFDDFEERIL